MPVLSVILPTFNEADHIQELLAELERVLQAVDYEVLVIDDDSPDGTYHRVLEIQKNNPRIVSVLRQHERGLATAVLEGFRRAQGEFVAVMDSDFQHPPEAVARLLAAAQAADLDLVVGSRYAAGGSVGGFSRARRLVSWGAKALAVLGLPSVRRFRLTDPMSGLFLVRRTILDVASLRPRGYKILIEVLARAPLRSAKEVGYAFQSRRTGQSKLRVRTQWDYFRHVAGLAVRERENLRFALFALVGTTGIVVNGGVYAAGKFLFHVTDPTLLLLPAAVAREASILWNFAWNDAITFRDLRATAHAGFFHRVLRFNAVSLVAWGAYLGIFYLLVVGGVYDLLALLIAILLTFLVNYGGNRRWTYAARTTRTV